jgi:tetratricopeptide (TPR) repeat protein
LSNAQLQNLLQQGGQAFSQGNLATAEQCCRAILAQVASEPNALHLLGLIRRRQGRFAEAEQQLRKALGIQPANAQMLNNLGNLLRDMNRPQEAVGAYEKAAGVQAGFAEPFFNMGLAYQSMDQHQEAIAALEKARAIMPSDPRFANAMGISFKETDQLEKAVEAYAQALKVKPDYYRALHNMGVALRMQDRQAEALDYYMRAMEIEPRIAELRYNLANALYELGRYDEADEQYRTAIALKPDFLDAHETLNQMYWEHGKRDLFAKSYQIGIKNAPKSPELREAYIKSLELAGNQEAAEAVVDEALSDLGGDAGLFRRKARILAAKGDVDASVDYFAKAVNANPEHQPIRMDFSRLLIQKGDYESALGHLEAAEALNPFDQEMWCYRGLCWRFLGDKREAWLNDYDAFVRPQRIDTPDGYGSLDEFLEELGQTVTDMHVTQVRPLEQTLRGGTQTHGRLFFRPVPIVQTLRQQLEICIARYIDALPDDADHPLLGRKSRTFRFAGSWSVRLTKDGFHVNHVHPAGWISSAFYVQVPDSVRDTDEAHEGWIKFGESGLSLGEGREEIKKIIKPEPGLLALFPSYVWHGTVPFTDDGVRMTTPFDVVPT